MATKAEAIALLKKLEWAGVAYGQGSGYMGSGGDGTPYRACPVCHGIHRDGSREFNAFAIGHKKSCKLIAVIGKEK